LGPNGVCSVWETQRGCTGEDLSCCKNLDFFSTSKRTVRTFDWDLKLKRMQNLTADYFRGMRET
jgi:hypothetical protein